ncbi:MULTISPECIES: DMT family transporter [Cobetia]|uniref:DMT family transporter n=1 Tax=Cobetia TaxID=204286 RepID=UPI001583FA2E|nr:MULTISPECIES: DMT family transporter [Cobetia]MDI4661002.1 DMT family transporter [Cobetia sp. BMC6]NUJ55680.1 EamA family transporter [Cobetia marina]
MQHSFSRTPFRPALERQIGNLSVLTAALLWGTTGTAAHFNQDVSPLATGAFAMGFGGILQAVLSRRILHEELAALLVHKHLVLWAALFIIVYPLAFYSAMEYTGVAMGTVITIATAPLAAAVLEYVLDRKRVSVRWYAALMLGMAGVGLMAVGETRLADTAAQATASGVASESRKLIGIGLGVLAGASYATYSLLARRMMLLGVHRRAAMGTMFGCAGVILLIGLAISCLFLDPRLFATPVNSAVAIYMALIPMLLASLIFGRGLASAPISRVTVLTMFEPLVAGLLAVIVVGEQFTLMGAIGMVLIMTCLMLQLRPQATQAPMASPQADLAAWTTPDTASDALVEPQDDAAHWGERDSWRDPWSGTEHGRDAKQGSEQGAEQGLAPWQHHDA